MSELLHYTYFLSSEEDAIGAAWSKLLTSHGLKEADPDPVEHGANVSRWAEGDGVSIVLSVVEHIAVLEFQLEYRSTAKQMAERDEMRQELGDELFDAVGESTFLINPDSEFVLTGKPLPGINLEDGSLAVVPEDEENPRLYVFSSGSNTRLRRLIRERFTALDCLSHELLRQLDYDEDQHSSIVGKVDEMNRQIGQVLNDRSKDFERLEAEVDTISEIHAQMTNYNFLLGNITHLLRTEISRFDLLHAKAIGGQDPFFQDWLRQKADQFLASLTTSQRELSRSLGNAKSAVDVVKSRVDLNRSRTNLDLQHQITSMMKQNVAIQEEMLVTGIAASMVEFFLVVYYGLGVWKTLAGEELMHHIPLAIKVGLISLFSLSVVVGTHKTAKAIKEKTKKGVLLWGLIILALMVVMVGVSSFFAH